MAQPKKTTASTGKRPSGDKKQPKQATHESQTTIDHDVIRKWTESRDGRPAAVSGTHSDDDGGLLRIDFGDKEDNLDEISWEQFFETFEERKLAFLYQEQTKDGGTSRFFKLVRR